MWFFKDDIYPLNSSLILKLILRFDENYSFPQEHIGWKSVDVKV